MGDNRYRGGRMDSNRYEEEVCDGNRAEYETNNRLEREIRQGNSNQSVGRQEEIEEEESSGEERQDNGGQISEFERIQQLHITSYLRRLYCEGRLLSHPFFLIHINIFDEEWYVPAEAALTFFTLNDGIGKSVLYHNIFKTNFPPTTRIAERVHENAVRTHKIFPSGGPNKILDIIREMFIYINHYKETTGRVILFATPNNINNVVRVLRRYAGDDFDSVYVFDVTVLFYHVKNLTFQENNDTRVHFDRTSQVDMLNEDRHCFNLELSCWYHLEVNDPMFCSKAILDRTVFMICEDCCGLLGIALVRGHHLPVFRKVTFFFNEEPQEPNVATPNFIVPCTGVPLDNSNTQTIFLSPQSRGNNWFINTHYTILPFVGSPASVRDMFNYSPTISRDELWESYIDTEIINMFESIMRDT